MDAKTIPRLLLILSATDGINKKHSQSVAKSALLAKTKNLNGQLNYSILSSPIYSPIYFKANSGRISHFIYREYDCTQKLFKQHSDPPIKAVFGCLHKKNTSLS